MVGWPPSVPQWEWDFVQGTDPTTETTVDEGNTWYDSTNNEGYVYDGGAWVKTTVGEYLELGGTLPPEDVANDTVIARMIAADAVTNTQVAENAVDTPQIVADAVTNALVAADAIDTEQVSNDAITTALIAADAVTATEIANNAVSESHLSFATATQSELDGHEGDTTNPHNVTDDQTGAADALNAHESDTTNPHNVTDSQTGAATALSNHAGDVEAHQPKQILPTTDNFALGPIIHDGFSSSTSNPTVYGDFDVTDLPFVHLTFKRSYSANTNIEQHLYWTVTLGGSTFTFNDAEYSDASPTKTYSNWINTTSMTGLVGGEISWDESDGQWGTVSVSNLEVYRPKFHSDL